MGQPRVTVGVRVGARDIVKVRASDRVTAGFC